MCAQVEFLTSLFSLFAVSCNALCVGMSCAGELAALRHTQGLVLVFPKVPFLGSAGSLGARQTLTKHALSRFG